jgi:hypothetical protein
LTGPPRINGWQSPHPSKRAPLEAAWSRDEDLETYVQPRNGRLRRVGPRHYRGTFRYGWAALPYDLAHAIVSAVSEHPVALTPRTKEASDPDYLTEYTFDCRVVGEVPTATPIFRRGAGGERLARVEIELQTLETVTEIPDSISGGVEEITA